MALSLTLHGLAVLPLFLIAATLGNPSFHEPARIAGFAVAAPALAPDAGNAAATQQATAASADVIVFEGKPRFRVPAKPAAYPARAIELGQQGEVLVRARLDLDGSVAEIRLWRTSGFDALDRSALAAVRGWHFHPAMRGGHPVAAWVEIPVRFHLR
jgi:protein TonB